MRLIKIVLPFCIILFCSIWAILPLFHAGFFPMHDDTQVARVFEMHKALADGMFPVRWVSDLGYGAGYPIFNFYAPLAYYVGALFMFTFASALTATKIMLGLGIVLSGITMYLFAKEFWGKKGGIISALFYVYAVYHALDIYVRGDVAEFYAYAFIPLVFYGLLKACKTKSFKYTIVGSLAYAGIILSHNLTAFMVTPFVAAFILILIVSSKSKPLTTFYLLLTTFLGILLSAFYWIPAIFESKYTNVLSQVGGSADFHEHFVCLQQLWSSPWGFGGSTVGCTDGISFMLGKLLILFCILGVVVLLLVWKKNRLYRNTILISLAALLFSLFLTLESSKFIWESLPYMAFLQYPWRFLILASFFASLIAGSCVYLLQFIPKKSFYTLVSNAIFFAVLIVVVLYSSKFFLPQKIKHVDSNYYTNSKGLFEASKISDEYLPKDFLKPQKYTEIAKQTNAQSIENKTQEKVFIYSQTKASQIVSNVAYFPAWQVSVDAKSVPAVSKTGRVAFVLPEGRHTVIIRFIQTPAELLGNVLSLAGIAALFVDILFIFWFVPRRGIKAE